MSNPAGVFVVGETRSKQASPITFQLIWKGRELADTLGEDLSVILMGHNLSDACNELSKYEVDNVYITDDLTLEDYHPELFVECLLEIVNSLEPNILLFGQTIFGRDLAPLIAGNLKSGLATNCIELEIEPATRLLVHTRPVFGGNARLRTTSNGSFPQIATLKPNSAPSASESTTHQSIISEIPLQSPKPEPIIKLIDRVLDVAGNDVSLEDAKIIVSGGLGVGGREGFELLEEMAFTLGGAVGSSLPPVNAGTVPNSYHIGQTGKIVSPAVYFAIGISGQPQHLAGCEGSEVIVAINTDKDANIFNSAKFGVVGDFRQIVPAFTRKCQELKTLQKPKDIFNEKQRSP